jgi:hypothetical protein
VVSNNSAEISIHQLHSTISKEQKLKVSTNVYNKDVEIMMMCMKEKENLSEKWVERQKHEFFHRSIISHHKN